MSKLIRNDEVAVLVSPGFGAGWSTWNGDEDMVFNKRLVLAVLNESGEDPLAVAVEEYPDAYHGGVDDLEVEWLPVGTAFRINEYDGSECLEVMGSVDYKIA